MQNGLRTKFAHLQEILRGLGSAVIAFSGGVDSTFLLASALKTDGFRAVPMTVITEAIPSQEREGLSGLCAQLGAELRTLDMQVCALGCFRENPPDRCYHCKRAMFTHLLDAAHELGVGAVIDGTNDDDPADYRPGMRALSELGIRSPLRESALTKSDIRALSREMALPTWDRPSAACLASRIPYGEAITPEKLMLVDRAERLLLDLGFKQVRVRLHGGDLARIEVAPAEMTHLLENRDSVTRALHEYGIRYPALDLDGYRTGSLNEALEI